MRLGIDVGGTNTDAVLMDGRRVVAWAKRPTSCNVSDGIIAVTAAVLRDAGLSPTAVKCVMVGTTHFTNALVERRNLLPVAVLRLASPSGEALPPLAGWPSDLVEVVLGKAFMLQGGFEFDGREIAPFSPDEVMSAAREIRAMGLRAVAVSSAFAPINSSMERRAAEILRAECPALEITLSCEIGRIGLLERENASILNASLSDLAQSVVTSFVDALDAIGLHCPLYISQNDGTLMSAQRVARHPVLTVGSGPTNSMRGAAFLTGLKSAVVMDIGGTTADIGVLVNGFPRESAASVDIGGVPTNFRMPDIIALGLGGGTVIRVEEDGAPTSEGVGCDIRIGPDSVGFKLLTDAMVFGGQTLTATDIAVAAGLVAIGDVEAVSALNPVLVNRALDGMRKILEDGVDRMKTAAGDVPVVLVGGGAMLVRGSFRGASEVFRPEHAQVANAIGAAIAQVGGEVDRIFDYDRIDRQEALAEIRRDVFESVVDAGGHSESVELVELEEIAINYLPGRATSVRAKAVGALALQ